MLTPDHTPPYRPHAPRPTDGDVYISPADQEYLQRLRYQPPTPMYVPGTNTNQAPVKHYRKADYIRGEQTHMLRQLNGVRAATFRDGTPLYVEGGPSYRVDPWERDNIAQPGAERVRARLDSVRRLLAKGRDLASLRQPLEELGFDITLGPLGTISAHLTFGPVLTKLGSIDKATYLHLVSGIRHVRDGDKIEHVRNTFLVLDQRFGNQELQNMIDQETGILKSENVGTWVILASQSDPDIIEIPENTQELIAPFALSGEHRERAYLNSWDLRLPEMLSQASLSTTQPNPGRSNKGFVAAVLNMRDLTEAVSLFGQLVPSLSGYVNHTVDAGSRADTIVADLRAQLPRTPQRFFPFSFRKH